MRNLWCAVWKKTARLGRRWCSDKCWKLRERQRRTDSLDDPDAPEPRMEAQAEETVHLWERQHLLRRAVSALSEQCRTLIELFFFQESPDSYEELSRRLGRHVASIGPTRGRCLEKLKKKSGANRIFLGQ